MEKITINSLSPVPSITDIDKIEHNLVNSDRYTLLTFFRFATCPFCNLRLRTLNQFLKDNGDKLKIIGIFGSDEGDVRKAVEIHSLSFPLVSNTDKFLYRLFGVEKSWLGVLKGSLLRFPDFLKGMGLVGKIPRTYDGMLNSMPASFLLDKEGLVLETYYGKDEGDHISCDRILEIWRR